MTIRSLQDLNAAAQELTKLSRAIEATAQAEQRTIDGARGDSSRSASWKAEVEAKVRRESKVPEMLAELNARYAEMQDTKPIWTTPLIVLSKEPLFPASIFKDSSADNRALYAAQEATIKMNIRAELKAMGQGLAEIWATEAAMVRQWARVYQAALVLEKLPFSLDSLPIEALEVADEAYHQADVARRSGEIAATELAGRKATTQRIGLGLLIQEHDRKKARRQAGIRLNYDERKAASLDETKTDNQTQAELDAIPELRMALPSPGR